MNRRNIGYWAATGLATAGFVVGGAMDVVRGTDVDTIMAHLGYPAYLATLLGVWKLLGGVAIAMPRFPRLKEWAYAGMLFDLSGAAFSHAATGDPAAKVVTPLVLLAVVAASWALRPASRRLDASLAPAATPVPRSAPALRAA